MIRVPVPNGSLVILNLESEKTFTSNKCHYEKNSYELVEQIKYSIEQRISSSDTAGTSVLHRNSNATIVSNDGKKNIVLYIWYDNEYGLSHQVIY
jgi:glyceraldehyde 3-phosphate dehydrogenase